MFRPTTGNALPHWLATGLIAAVVFWQASSCCCCLGGAVTPAMTPLPISRDLAQAMRERLMQAKAEQGPFTITITDQELTSYLVALTQSGPGDFPARDMQLQFGAGYVEIWATFIEVAPGDVPAYVRATVEAVDGQLVFHILQANAGAIPVPGAMREAIAQSLSETLAELQLGLEIARVEIAPDQMTLSGRVVGDVPDLP